LTRIAPIALLSAALLSLTTLAPSQRGAGYGPFSRYPFDQWAAENQKPQIRWYIRVDPARLSPHQRIVTQLHATVDAAELRKHQGNGQILMLARIEDAAGHRYQTWNQTAIAQLHQGDTVRQLDWNISAFILPGDYVLLLAVCDTRTLEHSFVRRRLHIDAINSEPLPNMWKGLLPVEFLPVSGNPEAWYLPQMHSRIVLPVETQRPVRVELLVNTTPAAPGSLNTFRQNMELVVPSMKVLMGIDPVGGGIGLSVVDLNRRALSFQQPDLRVMNGTWGDWLKLRPALAEARNATVDLNTLAGQHQMMDYLAAEAARRLAPANPSDAAAHVLIVLSAPLSFTEQDKPPAPDVPPDPARRIFYIRYSPLAILRPVPGSEVDYSNLRVPLYPFTDDIERALKPMGARVFRVSKPEEFRKALAAILDEIGKMQVSR